VDSDREEGEGPGDMLQAWLGELDTLKKVSRAPRKGSAGRYGRPEGVGGVRKRVSMKARCLWLEGQHECLEVRDHCRSLWP
jgi:hypothetical protein